MMISLVKVKIKWFLFTPPCSFKVNWQQWLISKKCPWDSIYTNLMNQMKMHQSLQRKHMIPALPALMHHKVIIQAFIGAEFI